MGVFAAEPGRVTSTALAAASGLALPASGLALAASGLALPASGLTLAALAVAVLAAGWHWRARRYRTIFRIPARRDDGIVCRDPSPAAAVLVDPDGLVIPAGVVQRGQTVLLALDTESTFGGRIFDPFIEVSQGPRSFRQYFEQGVAGRRYLNLSPLFQASENPREVALDDAPERPRSTPGAAPERPRSTPGAAPVRLRGVGVRWTREASLVAFDPPRLDGEAVLVVAPHPDDAEIAAFGIYAGRRSWVATLTAGEKGTSDLSAVCSTDDASRWKARLRVWDSLTLPELGGVPRERCLNLVYPDGRLPAMHARPTERFAIDCEATLPRAELRAANGAPEFRDAGRACTWNGFVEELGRLIEHANPGVIVCPHPLLDSHPDHVFSTVALEQAVRGHAARDCRFLLYVVHGRGGPAYPFGPRSAVVSLPPCTDPDWLAGSIYSHPLPPDVQRAKYFAVASVHDERTFESGERKDVVGALRAVRREVFALLGGTGLRPASFLRRAPRPNEILFRRLRSRALAAREPRPRAISSRRAGRLR